MSEEGESDYLHELTDYLPDLDGLLENMKMPVTYKSARFYKAALNHTMEDGRYLFKPSIIIAFLYGLVMFEGDWSKIENTTDAEDAAFMEKWIVENTTRHESYNIKSNTQNNKSKEHVTFCDKIKNLIKSKFYKPKS